MHYLFIIISLSFLYLFILLYTSRSVYKHQPSVIDTQGTPTKTPSHFSFNLFRIWIKSNVKRIEFHKNNKTEGKRREQMIVKNELPFFFYFIDFLLLYLFWALLLLLLLLLIFDVVVVAVFFSFFAFVVLRVGIKGE